MQKEREITTDFAQAEQFINLIASGEKVTFQIFPQSEGSKVIPRILHGTFEQHKEYLAEQNRLGAGIFIMVNAGDLKGRRKENVIRIRAVYIDLDGVPLGAIESALIEPHIITETSPGRYHVFYLVSDCKLEEFTSIQKALIEKFDGDPVVHDLSRVMRVPGFINYKGEEPHLVSIQTSSCIQPYQTADIVRGLSLDLSSESGEAFDRRSAMKGVKKGERNPKMFKLACSCRARGNSKKEIWQALCEANSKNEPPLLEKELKQLCRSAWSYKEGDSSEYVENVCRPQKIGKSLSKAKANRAMAIDRECPDFEFKSKFQSILSSSLKNKKITKDKAMEYAGRFLLSWLCSHGRFIFSDEDILYYFHKDARRVIPLESDYFIAFLYSLSGVSPSTNNFNYLLTDCKTQAVLSEKEPVYRVSYWDKERQLLYVSKFDGGVCVLDGTTIAEEGNGENVLFLDEQHYDSYEPNLSNKEDKFNYYCSELPSWEDGNKGEIHGVAFGAWILASFFVELCPTRPIALFVGEKGSGKSMNFRLLQKLMFGSSVDVANVPDKQDAFVVGASSVHFYLLDNLDKVVSWMRDKLARLSTGGVDYLRKLYTTNEKVQIKYRCFCGITSRTPDTLRRDDLADRLLIFPVKRIEQGKKAERFYLEQTIEDRNAWWGNVLNLLNKIVLGIRNGQLIPDSELRLADFDSFGRLYAESIGKLEVWKEFVSMLQESQSDFLLEGDIICEAIEKLFASNSQGLIGKLTARELREELGKYVSDKDGNLPLDWPRTSKSFGNKLKFIRNDLKKRYGLCWEQGTTTESRGRLVYYFEGRVEDESEIPI